MCNRCGCYEKWFLVYSVAVGLFRNGPDAATSSATPRPLIRHYVLTHNAAVIDWRLRNCLLNIAIFWQIAHFRRRRLNCRFGLQIAPKCGNFSLHCKFRKKKLTKITISRQAKIYILYGNASALSHQTPWLGWRRVLAFLGSEEVNAYALRVCTDCTFEGLT